MSRIKPFCAYRPSPENAARVASVPYDVIDTKEARELSAGNALSFLHVARPEIDLPVGTPEHDDRVYAKGAENLRGFITTGALHTDDGRHLYVYQQRMGDHVQAGLVCLCSVKEYEDDLIKKHELTRREKEDDRTRHVAEQNANAEPVFLTYRAVAAVDRVIDGVRAGKPDYDFVSPDGIGHTVWTIRGEALVGGLVDAFAHVPALYIADGHHRTAAAVRYGQQRRNAKTTPDSPFESFLAVVFPHDQLRIMDYNRVVKDLNGLTPDAFIARVSEKFEITPAPSPAPDRPATFGMYFQGKWHRLTARPGTFPAHDPVKSLDVSLLQDNLLGPVLGIADPRTDKRIDFVGGIRGLAGLEKRVAEGAAVAFALFPTSLPQLMNVADAGQIMPPKSTWFEPKLRSGLLVRVYED